MKVKALARLMNDHGTKPRIKVLKHTDDYALLAYEGRPGDIDKTIAELRVNSFTALGTGFIEIHAQEV